MSVIARSNVVPGALTPVYTDDVAVKVRTNAGAPVSGASGGTYAGVAEVGSLLVDVTNAKLYINTGTVPSPTWTVVGTQS